MSYRRMIFSFVLAGALFLISCDEDATSTSIPDASTEPISIDTMGPALSLVEESKPSINLPNIYIIVDDSISMIKEDYAGLACDPDGTRYKLAYFLWNIINDWKAEGIVDVNQQTSVWFLDGNNGNGKFHNVSSSPQDELLRRLEEGDSFFGRFHEFYLIFSSQTLENEIPDNSDIIFITDGDFRSSRDTKNIQNVTWENQKEEIATGIQNLSNKGVETYFLLLCPQRLNDANLDDVKDVTMLYEWTKTIPNHGAYVYGIDRDFNGGPKIDQQDFSSKLFEVLSQVLGNLYNAYGSGLVWNVVDRNGYGAYVDASTMFFYAGGTSYEKDPLQDHSFEIRLDGDLNFPNILIPNNGEECAQHYVSVLDVDDVALIWRQEQLLNFNRPANGKILFYNDQPSELRIQIPNGINWLAWKNCLASKIQLSDGTILASNFEDDSSGNHILKIYSPQTGDTFQEYDLDLTISWNNLVVKEIQNMPLKLKYIRVYSPEYLTPVINLGDNKIQLNYKFLNKLGSTDLYHPTLFFSDTDCSLFYPNKYKPSGSPYQQGVSITVEKERYLIAFINNSIDFRNCKKMQVQWNDWPDQYLKYKPEIVACNLSWDDSGRFLDSVECQYEE